MWKLIIKLIAQWLDPVPGLDDLSSTHAFLSDMDIEAHLAERELQSYDRINPYV